MYGNTEKNPFPPGDRREEFHFWHRYCFQTDNIILRLRHITEKSAPGNAFALRRSQSFSTHDMIVGTRFGRKGGALEAGR